MSREPTFSQLDRLAVEAGFDLPARERGRRQPVRWRSMAEMVRRRKTRDIDEISEEQE